MGRGVSPPQCSPPTGRSLRSCLISSRIFSCRVLCFCGKGRSLLSETWGEYGSSRKERQWGCDTDILEWGGTLVTQPGLSGAGTAGGRREVPCVLPGQVHLRINLSAPSLSGGAILPLRREGQGGEAPHSWYLFQWRPGADEV